MVLTYDDVICTLVNAVHHDVECILGSGDFDLI